MPRGNPKTPTLHNWALITKAGKTSRVTAATTRAKAQAEFLKSLRRGALPKGWGIRDQGPVEPARPVIPPAPGPAPRPFRVGDRVRGQRWGGTMAEGVVHAFDNDGDPYLGNPLRDETPLLRKETVVLLESASQPKAEDGQMPPNPFGLPITSLNKAQDGRVLGVAYGEMPEHRLLTTIRMATGIRAMDEPDLAAAVRSIASQVDRHRKERDAARANTARLQERAEAAEAELRDAKENITALGGEVARMAASNSALLCEMQALKNDSHKLADIRAALRIEALGFLTDTRLEDAIQSILDGR